MPTYDRITTCVPNFAARLAKPGRRHEETAPTPGRARGYLPGRGDLWDTSPALQTGRQPPPAPPGDTSSGGAP